LAGVFRRHGYPALFAREPGFGTLVHIILEQQVSLASANAAFARLCGLTGALTPQAALQLNTETFRAIGVSRQKSGYIHHLAESVIQGRIELDGLGHLSDEEAREVLTGLKGIGLWTADIYLSECLLRPDILPKGDIGMLEAVKVLYQLDGRPDHDTFVAIASQWRPWRSVGTRMLWLHYMNN
jgi:DNA-3-methyladenine glycosylase II